MKKFIIKTILSILPVFILLVSVNYFGDAARLFDSGYEKRMTTILFSGKYITNISNYDDRVFQKEIIENIKNTPETIVIGSSRTMLIDSSFAGGGRFFNHSVSGASLEDEIAIYQIYKENKKLPKNIWLGIDPWFFNEDNGQERWKSIGEYYSRFFNNDTEENSELYKYSELISFSYFQSSLKKLPAVISGKDNPVATTNLYNKTNTKLTDGSITYGKTYREASPEKVRSKAEQYLTGELYSLDHFNEISPELWNNFEKFISELKKYNINISLILTPYHPIVYNRIKDDYKQVIVLEEKLRSFAELNNIKLHGSYNPEKINLDENHFFDGMHCKREGIVLTLK